MKILRESKVAKRIFLTVFAMVVIVLSFTLAGEKAMAAEDDVVYIPDANFKAYLNEKLGVDDPTADITEGQMATIKGMKICVEDNISDITGIAYCTNLYELFINGSDDNMLTLDSNFRYNLSQLKSVYWVDLHYINSNDYNFMQTWSNLVCVWIYDCNIEKLPDFSKCPYITNLELWYCDNLSDISSISKMDYLDYLKIYNCEGITDISPLKGKKTITDLIFNFVKITEDNKESYMETISSLTNLEYIKFYCCDISDEHTPMFQNLTKLKDLNLDSNNISKLDFLRNNDVLEFLTIRFNKLSSDNTEILGELTSLQNLNIDGNYIIDFSFIKNLPNLNKCSCSWTKSEVVLVATEESSTCVFKNDVKDADGNYVAPLESYVYTYNEETQEITVLLDKLYSTATVDYEFYSNTINGEQIKISHEKSMKLANISQIGELIATSDSTVELDIGISGFDEFEYQWYKDGNIITGATGEKLVIENVTLEDAGDYKVIVKHDYGTTVSEGTLIVKPYKIHTGKLEISGISEDMIAYKGDKITYTVETSGGSGEYEYTYVYKNGDDDYYYHDEIENVYTMKIYSWYYTGEIELFVKIKDKDSNIEVCTNTVNITVYDYNTLQAGLQIDGISESLIGTVGDAITLNASATGGSGDYTYKYAVEKVATGEIVTLKNYSTATSYASKFILAGTKRFIVYVKDSLGKVVESNSITVNVYEPLKSTLIVNGPSDNISVNVGKSISFITMAEGGAGDYKYKYIEYDVNTKKWRKLADNLTTGTYNWVADIAGNKRIYVDVTDSAGNVARSAPLNITVTEPLKATMKTTAESTIVVGDKITLTATATGGSGQYKYCFKAYKKESSERYNFTDYISDNTYTLTTEDVGNLIFYVEVMDGSSIVITNEICIEIKDKLSVSGVITSSKIEIGDQRVTIIGTVQGGIGSYTYSYIVHNKTTNKWYRIADNISSPVYVWTPSFAGNCVMYIDVKDSTGTIARSSGLKISVTEKLSVMAKASENKTTVGDKITFTATAEGGLGNYTYSFIVYNKDTKKWARLADNITSNTYTWTAKSVGNRVFYIDVKDSTGKIVRSEAISVSTTAKVEELSVTAKTTLTELKTGEKLTLTATATGGSGKYTYSFIVYNKDTKKWARLADNITSKNYTWKAKSAGNRVFYVDVKDSTGKIVRSEKINVSVK